ncbi:MAG: hypothetical protein II453_05290 [Alphaproteobacteria bacterium]|nr:hypothetical protein [Alphaproteobacteria bacterium]
MKKLLLSLFLSLIVVSADARVVTPTYSQGYSAGYYQGQRQGKSNAYNNVVRTTFFVATAVVVGVIIYELGKESRWTAHDGQVHYRF